MVQGCPPEVRASALSSSPLQTDSPPPLSTPCAPCAAISAARLDHQALGDFISQPDIVSSLDDLPYTFDAATWKAAHQLTFSLVMGLSYGSTTYLFHLTTRDQIPSGNEWKMEAENFEWHGSLPGHPRVILSFALVRRPSKSPGRATNLPLATEAERFPVPQ